MKKTRNIQRFKSDGRQLATAKFDPRFVLEFSDLENDLYTIMTVVTFVAVPGVPSEILRLQLQGLDHELDTRLQYYGELLRQGGEDFERARPLQDWMLIFKQLQDIRDGIAQAVDPEHPDDGAALRAALRRHMQPEHRQRWERIARTVEKQQQAAEAATAAKLQQAAEQARIDALTPRQRHMGLIQWGINQVKCETGQTQAPAAKTLLDRMKPAFSEGRLSAELKAVYHDLETRCGSRDRIRDVMDYDTIPVPWENGSTRL